MSNPKDINKDQFKRYFQGEMSSAEKAAFEKELEQDPFAQEAMEGFAVLESSALSKSAIERVEEKVIQRTGGQIKRAPIAIPFRRIAAIAASVLLLFGGAFMVTQLLQEETKLADNSNNTTKEVIEPVKDEAIISNVVSSSEDSAIDKTFNWESLEENEILFDNLEEEVEASPVEEVILEDNAYPSPVVNNDIAANNDNISVEDLEFAQLKPSNEPTIAAPLATEEEMEESLSQTAPSATTADYNREAITLNEVVTADKINNAPSNPINHFNNGMQLYQSGNMSEAINSFNKAVNNGEKVTESQYYIGLAYNSSGKPLKAIKAFDQVIGSSSSLKNNAKWYKASILIGKGKDAEAKILLQELVNSNSSFKNNAQELLNNM